MCFEVVFQLMAEGAAILYLLIHACDVMNKATVWLEEMSVASNTNHFLFFTDFCPFYIYSALSVSCWSGIGGEKEKKNPQESDIIKTVL